MLNSAPSVLSSKTYEAQFLDICLNPHVMQAHPPATARSVSTDAASLRKENSSPAAAVESRPSLPKAAPDQGSLPTAPMEKQPSLPRAAQKQGSTPASQQQQQENSVYESEGACTWSPPPDKELAPFLSSTMALFDRALPGGSGHADAASQDSTISNRYVVILSSHLRSETMPSSD